MWRIVVSDQSNACENDWLHVTDSIMVQNKIVLVAFLMFSSELGTCYNYVLL